MNSGTCSRKSDYSRLRIALASEEEKKAVYCLRHEVYASELEQYDERAEGFLSDSPGIESVYITAFRGDELVGFIGITPPSSPRYSIDKYLPRHKTGISFDSHLYEFRALTVKKSFRNTPAPVAAALLYAAFRWVESRRGTSIMAFGRTEVLALYLKFGFEEMGRSFRCGAVNFDLISAETKTIAARLPRFRSILKRIETCCDWHLEIGFHRLCDCYHGGAFFDAVGDRFDKLDRKDEIISADVLDAWFPPAPGALEVLTSNLSWAISTSPPTHAQGLIRNIAQARQVEPWNILAGAGSSTLIFQAFRHFLSSSSRVLILDPTYGEYSHLLENIVRCKVERLTLSREDGFRIDLDYLSKKLKQSFDLFVWVNPNSPTGQHVARESVEAVLTGSNCRRVWIDETYIEYAGYDQSVELMAARSENVIVCKSLSKVYALSGLRIAYLCAAAHQLEELKRLNPPWPVSLPGQIVASYALNSRDYYDSCYRQTHELRKELVNGLRELGIVEIINGVANFVLFYLPARWGRADRVLQACRTKGLYLRDASSMGTAMGKNAIRVAVKDSATNQRMLNILASALEPHNFVSGEAGDARYCN